MQSRTETGQIPATNSHVSASSQLQMSSFEMIQSSILQQRPTTAKDLLGLNSALGLAWKATDEVCPNHLIWVEQLHLPFEPAKWNG